MKSGNIKYWETQLKNSTDINFTLLVLFTWATPKTIIQLYTILSTVIKDLTPSNYLTLIKGLNSTVQNSTFNRTQQKYIEDELKNRKSQDEFKYIISIRFDESNGQKYIYENIEKFTGVLEKTIEIKFQYLIITYLNDPTNETVLQKIKLMYKNIQQFDERFFFRYMHQEVDIPYDIAKTIMEECREYPRILSSFAERTCRIYANENLKAIGEIAISEKWFEDN